MKMTGGKMSDSIGHTAFYINNKTWKGFYFNFKSW